MSLRKTNFFIILYSILHPIFLLLLHPHLASDPRVWRGWVVAGLVVELTVGPRG